MAKDFDWSDFWQKHSSFFWVRGMAWYGSGTLIKLLKDLKGIEACLELGGGPGLLAKTVAQKLNYKLTLVENDPETYKLFKKYSNFGVYVRQDLFAYRPKKKFDLVFSLGLIEHFPDKKKRLEVTRIHKKLSKKYVAIFVPKKSFWVERFAHCSKEEGFEKLYRREELERELKTAGLKPIKFAQNLHGIGFLCKV